MYSIQNRYVVLGPRKLLGNTSAPKKPATPEIGYLDDDMSGIDDVFENQSEDFFQPRFPSSDVRLSIYRSRVCSYFDGRNGELSTDLSHGTAGS